ncbi:glycosyltransferase family 2 protein [Anaerolineales bacterium]
MDLAVIIITWNARDFIAGALTSLQTDLSTSGLDAQLIVLDNASQDGTADLIKQQFPDVTLLAENENLGFTRGNNKALAYLGFGAHKALNQLPKAVYLLNPDTLTQPGATAQLYSTLFSEEKNALVGAKLNYEDGTFQHSAFHFPGLKQLWTEFFPTPGRLIEGSFNGRYPPSLYEGQQAFEVDFVLGATMMLRSEALQTVGLLDESFFMYCEELDLAWRLHKAGWSVLCDPQAHVTHLEGRSSSQIRPQATRYLWESRLKLFQRYYPVWKYKIATHLIVRGFQKRLKDLNSVPMDPELKSQLHQSYLHIIQLAQA